MQAIGGLLTYLMKGAKRNALDSGTEGQWGDPQWGGPAVGVLAAAKGGTHCYDRRFVLSQMEFSWSARLAPSSYLASCTSVRCERTALPSDGVVIGVATANPALMACPHADHVHSIEHLQCGRASISDQRPRTDQGRCDCQATDKRHLHFLLAGVVAEAPHICYLPCVCHGQDSRCLRS